MHEPSQHPSTSSAVLTVDEEHHDGLGPIDQVNDMTSRVGALNGVRLLEAAPELGSRLTGDQLAQAQRHAILATVTLDPGHWKLERLRDNAAVHGEIRGFLVLSGVLTTEVTIAGRACIRLLTPRELVLTDGADADSVAASWGWAVLETAQIAILDDRLLVIAQHWPHLLSALLQRAGQQSQYALLQQAISQLPRVEDRLLALLWSIADRRGIVRSDGVWIDLPLTHETIAQMIGARRPTVTLGLRGLIDQGLLRADKDGWLVDPASLEIISPSVPTAESAGLSAPEQRQTRGLGHFRDHSAEP